MRVLLDEQLPRQLAAELTGHDVSTVQRQGWTGVTNGELLLRAAAAGFEVLLTADRNLEFQQNVSRAGIGVLVVAAPSNAREDLLSLVPSILATLPKSAPGRVVRVAG